MFKLSVKYTDGISVSSVLSRSYDCKDFYFTMKEDGGIYYPVFVPHKTDAVEYIELELVRDGGFFDGLFYLDSRNQSNDIAELREYKPEDDVEPREFSVMKNGRGDILLIGFVREHRFISTLRLRKEKITLSYEMENKTVAPDTVYELEPFIIREQGEPHELLEEYADTVARLNNAVPGGYIPTGTCTWSYYYSAVNNTVIKAAADGLEKYCHNENMLVQIDDCWQSGGSFCGTWYPDTVKFPDMKALSEYITEKKINFGLWVAPLIVSDSRRGEKALEGLLSENATLGDCYPYDFSESGVYEHLKRVFTRLKNDYNVKYFKLDFLWAAVKSFSAEHTYVSFKGDYAMAYYRKALTAIREAVGNEVYLLACGAPLLASAGILNGARTSCDIVWGRSEAYPTYWELIKKATCSNLYRYYYNDKVFRNDADGLCVRDFDCGDGFNASYSEARLWATTIAMSGGSVLINEDFEEIGKHRRELFIKLLPPLGIAAKPYDIFEKPCPSASYIDYTDDIKFLALYRWEDEKVGHRYFNASDLGIDNPITVDCWESAFKGTDDLIEMRHYNPHSAGMYMVRNVPETPAFLYSDINVWCGVNVYRSEYVGGKVKIYGNKNYGEHNIYVFYPTGFAPEGEIIKTSEKGTVCRYTDEIIYDS